MSWITMATSATKQIKHYAKSVAFLILLLFMGIALALYWDLPASRFGLKGVLPIPKGSPQGAKADGCRCNGQGQSSEVNSTGGSSHLTTPTNVDVAASRGDLNSTTSGAATTTAQVTAREPLLLTISHEYGRLGNRMFEYASLLGVGNATGRHAFVSRYRSDPDLVSLFLVTRVEDRVVDASFVEVSENKYAYFDPVFKNLPDHNVKITGYVQSWKYFDKIRNTIRKEFTLLPSVSAAVEKVKQAIRQKVNKSDPVFVGVHVRQKDDKSTPNTLEAPKSFFANAMEKMRSLLKGFDVVFLVAGNNLEWCQDNFNETDVVVLPPLPTEVHFAILSSCQHGIVSVGSFGWWMAWLTGGQVVFYKKFPAPNTYEYKGFVYEDYYPPHWIPVDD